jgi:hypothetical protein
MPGRDAPLDLATVRQERKDDEIQPGWRVLAGPDDEPVLLGYLEPARTATGGRGKGWQAITTGRATIPGGPWRSREAALAPLVEHYQRTRPS